MATITTTVVANEFRPSRGPVAMNDFSRHHPIEEYVTIDGLLKSHAAQPQQKPLICYPNKGVSDFEEYTATTLDRFTDNAVDFYLQNGLVAAVRPRNTSLS